MVSWPEMDTLSFVCISHKFSNTSTMRDDSQFRIMAIAIFLSMNGAYVNIIFIVKVSIFNDNGQIILLYSLEHYSEKIEAHTILNIEHTMGQRILRMQSNPSQTHVFVLITCIVKGHSDQ